MTENEEINRIYLHFVAFFPFGNNGRFQVSRFLFQLRKFHGPSLTAILRIGGVWAWLRVWCLPPR